MHIVKYDAADDAALMPGHPEKAVLEPTMHAGETAELCTEIMA